MHRYYSTGNNTNHRPRPSVSYVKSHHSCEFLHKIINLFATVWTDFIYFGLLLSFCRVFLSFIAVTKLKAALLARSILLLRIDIHKTYWEIYPNLFNNFQGGLIVFKIFYAFLKKINHKNISGFWLIGGKMKIFT